LPSREMIILFSFHFVYRGFGLIVQAPPGRSTSFVQ
jgi:hypothetical protein